MTQPATVIHAGDSTLLATYGDRIDPTVNACAVGLADAVRSARLPGVRDVIVTYRSVAVSFDPLAVDADRLADQMREIATAARQSPLDAEPIVEIPVRYGGADGPDLAEVARFAGCSEQEVVRRHGAPSYRVYMLGFMPGFAYMAPVEDRIAMPRRATPRIRVPAGSVGIAGRQTGVYPGESPGGWQLIGRTSITLFALDRDPPALLRPGSRVRFVAVGSGAAAEAPGAP